jgi:hypothetical protein
MEVPRKDPNLQEALDLLEARFIEAEGDPDVAYSLLSTFELNFIDEEIYKCLDFRYYAENYHIINSKHKGFVTLYPFWDSQEIFYAKILEIQLEGRPVKIIVLKARQLGLSTINEALLFHHTIFTEGCNSLVVAQDPGQADYLFEMSRFAYDSLPWWMRPESRYESKGRYIHFDRRDDLIRQTKPGLRSAIYVEAANKMSGVAVGKAITCCHLSELSLWPEAKVLAEQLFPTLSGSPGQIAIMESTARGRNNFWYDFWKDAWNGKVDWEPVFIEFFRVKKYSLPIPPTVKFERTKDEIGLAGKVEETTGIALADEQLYWRRKEMQVFASLNRGDESKFFQEYPSASWMEAFQGSGICAFNKKKLQHILETTCVPPRWYGEIDLKQDRDGVWNVPELRLTKTQKGEKAPAAEQHGARLYVWEQPEANEKYFVGADVAHGVQGGDFSCAQIIKIGHGMRPDIQVAEWHGWINPTPYANAVAALGYWYNTAEISLECNDVGLSSNAQLMRVLEYPNLFRWKHYDKITNFITNFTGWYTNTKTRDQIIAKFRESMDDEVIVIRSEDLVNECLDFSSEDDGRYEGQSTNDDRVFAMMIAIFCAHDMEHYGGEAPVSRTSSKKDIPKGVDFNNTDFSPLYDGKREKDSVPNEDDPPKDYALWEEVGPAPDDDLWRTI